MKYTVVLRKCIRYGAYPARRWPRTCGAILLAASLGACAPQPATVQGSLPGVPADIQACFRAGPAKVPQKALSVAEVESLWKQDRVHEVVLQRCGKRFLAWYGDLRKGWR